MLTWFPDHSFWSIPSLAPIKLPSISEVAMDMPLISVRMSFLHNWYDFGFWIKGEWH